MEINRFKQILLQALLLPVVALLLMAGALCLDILGANNTVNLIQQSDERIHQATLIAKLIIDQESGLRGYQTTADSQFLQPYNDAKSLLAQQLIALRDVPGADQAQRIHLQRFNVAYSTWLNQFAEPVIAAIQTGGTADEVAYNLHGKALMDDIRRELDIIIQIAQTRRAERIQHWRRQVRTMLEGIVILALLIGGAIGLFTRSRLHDVSDAYQDSLTMLKRRADELFESEQELRTTLASIGDGVIVCNADGTVQMMNQVAQDLTGWTQEEARNAPLPRVFEIVNETTRAMVENPVDKVKRLGGIVGLANHTVLIRKDGKELHIADSGAPILTKAGQLSGIVLVFRDVTLERKTQDALIANEKLAVAGRLAATIAHEIHNPLDSVSNLLYLMRTGTDGEESKQFMSIAEQELARVTQISRAMLGLYRESKTPVQVDLREMLQEILLLMDRRLIDVGVKVHTEMPEAIHIEGFPAELRQVFSNLITNAAEAAGRGGSVWISIRPESAAMGSGGVRSEAGATVEVRDDGPGISEETLPHLFQPFFTTKGEHGTGLGLWVSRGIVNKHGGTICLNSIVAGDAEAGARHGTIASVFLATKPTLQLGGD